METLHSVDRRKREALDDSIDLPESSPRAPLVAWKHDQRIRDAILQATEDDFVDPPIPTQPPRPISSKLSHSSTNISDPVRPRKRFCRNHRSLPPCLRNTLPSSSASHSLAGSSSVLSTEASIGDISGSVSAKTQLDLLLEQFRLQASPVKGETEERPQPEERAKRHGKENRMNSTRGKSKEKERRQQKRLQDEKAKKGDVPTQKHAELSTSPKMRGNSSSSILSHNSSATDISFICVPTHNTSFDRRMSHSSSISSIRSPLSPVKPGAAPRIGLGSQNKSSSKIPPPRVSTLKTFKTPFLEPRQGVRSSPRRIESAKPAIPQTSTCDRAYGRAPTTSSTHSTVSGPPSRATPSRPNSSGPQTRSAKKLASHPSGFTNFDVGEDEPEGDRSFDSFDGIFNEGGPEIEMLLRQVDGTQ
ncbi:hypothetical protein C343_00218 [Cryptococcus neoformans C23]|uniref:Uncharacterized protein n=2 Tax=Cryptococcus neoformans TaxID=5207 RepID=A0A854QRL0_CRYNE|nr:hypothetical protein CNAG_07030 [Cryptococcus neoformans var. grubii H99]AUB21775.1 hypothetical protein CKF44_07030 [Cryptococcus neoformans var. grubii]OWZ36940.1 hypothetical protein C347_00295 [Cryptococcus neoformans var. grubii AD2-60a]OWZ48771.1 hypothetical protein C343_00218 [Cryptococcus neoformans var. grubii C23]OXC87486.1 hypothetical protein C344_00230 [Cryptococcus neoformans var. grubii AD1-7a]OXG30129.1 hypothetical protein C361_00218 [Cryptococcus neoformans var. grubii Tu|eukprot:XP_012047010.1 hypothetical protein CNAG_07030 [Cryptococcus neoformans var. grubii H99]